MRLMINSDCSDMKIKVESVHVLVNGWEYFLEKPNKDGVAFGLVCGFEDELGSVYLPEIKPHILSSANLDCTDAIPAPGWEWADEDEVANI